jgi:hypothetical protein
MRYRFRLHSLMVAVALVALAMSVLINVATERKRHQYQRKVESFAFGEADVLEQIAEKLAEAREAESRGRAGKARAAELRQESERLARVAAWHVKMERRYASGVASPWSELPPEIPAP